LYKIYNIIIDAIAYLHERGLMHRDIKLENILLFDNDLIKLSDFGWACQCLDKKDTICGTPDCKQIINIKLY